MSKIIYDAIVDIFPPGGPIDKGQDKFFCPECRKTLASKEFFKTNRLDKYPSGYLPKCKACLTLKIKDNEPATFLPLLKEIDVPYIAREWKILVDKKDGRNISIFGKYVSGMRRIQFSKYRFADSKNLNDSDFDALSQVFINEGMSQTEAEKKAEQTMDITNVLITSSGPKTDKQTIVSVYGLTPETSVYGLTAEEITNLKMTWGQDYTEEEYRVMETFYNEMCQAYVIADPVAISSARVISKLTMQGNKFLDMGDIENATRILKMRDNEIKSSNLAPQQQKDRAQSTYAISQLAYLIEKQGGFIPQFCEKYDFDVFDKVFLDLQQYTEAVIQGEPQISDMIEHREEILNKFKIEEDQDLGDAFERFEKEIMGGVEDALPDDSEE